MILPFSQKNEHNILPKNALEGDLSGIIEKDDIPPRKYGISVEVPY